MAPVTQDVASPPHRPPNPGQTHPPSPSPSNLLSGLLLRKGFTLPAGTRPPAPSPLPFPGPPAGALALWPPLLISPPEPHPPTPAETWPAKCPGWAISCFSCALKFPCALSGQAWISRSGAGPENLHFLQVPSRSQAMLCTARLWAAKYTVFLPQSWASSPPLRDKTPLSARPPSQQGHLAARPPLARPPLSKACLHLQTHLHQIHPTRFPSAARSQPPRGRPLSLPGL